MEKRNTTASNNFRKGISSMSHFPHAFDLTRFFERNFINHQNIRTLSLTGPDAIKYKRDPSQQPFKLLLNGEDHLHILYGSNYSDWVCGGQWGPMMKGLDMLMAKLRDYHVLLAVCLNGSHEPKRFKEWVRRQEQMKNNTNKIFRRLKKSALPPPASWWVPPSGLKSVLRLGLATLNTPAFCSLDDYIVDIMDFYWKNNFNGVLGGSQDFFFFKCPRLFAPPIVGPSLDFNIITREYDLKGIGKSLGLNPAEFCLLGALLGNHILTTDDLSDFHKQLVPKLKKTTKVSVIDKLVKEVVYYIRGLPSVYNYEKIGYHVFGSTSEEPDPRVKKIRESMEYYFRGTLEGSRKHRKTEPLLIAQKLHDLPEEGIKLCSHGDTNTSTLSNGVNIEDQSVNELTSAFEEKVNLSVPSESEEIPSLVNNISSSDEKKNPAKEESHSKEDIKTIPIPYEVRRTATERHRLGAMSPYIYQVLCYGEIKFPVILENMKSSDLELPRIYEFYRPLRQYVYAILFNLHHHEFTRNQNQEAKRTLESKISRLLRKSENASPSDEDAVATSEKVKKLEKDLEALKLSDSHGVKIREWLPYNSYQKPFIVEGVEVPWGVPTVQRLWFGTSFEDKEKRIRAFMSCMRCDDVKPLLLQAQLIPPNFVFMACVLRYIMVSSKYPVLKKSELDVFLVTSLLVGTYIDPSKLNVVSSRGIQLASLFMEGVEMALFANDACGAPIPLHMTLPWTFFDGVLFHMYLRKAASVQNLYELCDNDEVLVSRIESMKSVIIPELMNNEYLIRYSKRNGIDGNGYYGFHERGRGSIQGSGFLRRGEVVVKKNQGIKGKPFSYNKYNKKTGRSTMKKKFQKKVNEELTH